MHRFLPSRKCRHLGRWLIAFASIISLAKAGEPSPERKALDYLAKEVPAWSRANRCFSCHHNGDAARALMAASGDGAFKIDPKSLADTLEFLARPEAWAEHEADAPNKDARLARLQFTSALAAAIDAGLIRDRAPLLRAARKLAADQSDDGSFPIGADENLGSPATYGRALATARARKALSEADPKRFAREIANADRWLATRPILNVGEASAVLLASLEDAKARGLAIAFLKQSQNADGGWGPFAKSPPEPFDTALALLALSVADRNESREVIRRGRKALIASQLTDGSWVETTRPGGAESYAQRLSTAGWATLALLATR